MDVENEIKMLKEKTTTLTRSQQRLNDAMLALTKAQIRHEDRVAEEIAATAAQIRATQSYMHDLGERIDKLVSAVGAINARTLPKT